MIKGFYIKEDPKTNKKQFALLTDLIEELLGIQCCCMFGANVAKECAKTWFAESTIAYDEDPENKWSVSPKQVAEFWQKMFNIPNRFSVNVVSDTASAHICAALKNCVALGCGFVDGLGMGGNTKAAILRKGLIEMMHFAKVFFGNVNTAIFFESCGIADLVTTCFGGRNRLCGEAFVKNPNKSFLEIEKEVLNGQKLEGLATLNEIMELIEENNKVEEFPLFHTIHKISHKKASPETIISA